MTEPGAARREYEGEKSRYRENESLDLSLTDFKRGVRQSSAFWMRLADAALAEADQTIAELKRIGDLDLRAVQEASIALEVCDVERAQPAKENGRMDDALHSAFQDYRDGGGKMTDFDAWLACHVNCGKEMRAP